MNQSENAHQRGSDVEIFRGVEIRKNRKSDFICLGFAERNVGNKDAKRGSISVWL